jgi:hypothetical protein
LGASDAYTAARLDFRCSRWAALSDRPSRCSFHGAAGAPSGPRPPWCRDGLPRFHRPRSGLQGRAMSLPCPTWPPRAPQGPKSRRRTGFGATGKRKPPGSIRPTPRPMRPREIRLTRSVSRNLPRRWAISRPLPLRPLRPHLPVLWLHRRLRPSRLPSPRRGRRLLPKWPHGACRPSPGAGGLYQAIAGRSGNPRSRHAASRSI